MHKSVFLAALSFVSTHVSAGEWSSSKTGACWYYNKYTHTTVDFDAYNKRRSCNPKGNWKEQCRDHKSVTNEVACRWYNAPAPGGQDMNAGSDMGAGTGGSDMNAGGDMGTGSDMGTAPKLVPNLSSLGISVTNGNQSLPGNWQQVKSVGVKVDPNYHKCNWVVRPVIYAFPDGVIYANADEQNINVFDHKTVRSFGCLLPSINGVSVQAPITEPMSNVYSGENRKYVAASLSSYGLSADNRAHPRDGRFNEMMGKALRISQADHQCKWAVRPLIYVFTDGVAYASVGGNDFNLFSFDRVRSQGCFVPTVYPQGSDMSTNDSMSADPSTGMDASGAGADGLGSMGN